MLGYLPKVSLQTFALAKLEDSFCCQHQDLRTFDNRECAHALCSEGFAPCPRTPHIIVKIYLGKDHDSHS